MRSGASLDDRLKWILQAYPDAEKFGFRDAADLREWVRGELGDCDCLDRLVTGPTGGRRARPLDPIYHICSGNLSVSAETSLLISLILGAGSRFKLPASGLPELEARIGRLPPEAAQRIRLLERHDRAEMEACEAVVVFGSDETVAEIRSQTTPRQRFLSYGHKISIGLVTSEGATGHWAGRAVGEILAYDQLGCLSPQSYLCPDASTASRFAESLVAAFESRKAPRGELPFEAQALHFEARQRALVAGDLVVSPSEPGKWVVIERSRPRIEPGPGFGFVEVVAAPDLNEALDPWRGLISSVSVSSDRISARRIAELEGYGIHRVCPMGDLQRPPIAWPHDGRPRLADLVRWTFVDPALQVEAAE